MHYLGPRHLLATVIAVAATAVAVAALAVTPAAAADDPLTTDLRLIAAARGWTLEQARAQHAVAERFGALQARIATMRPGLYAGASLSAQPGGAPTLYVKGGADPLIRDAIATAGLPVTLVEGRPLSWLELEARSQELHARLGALGFRDAATAFDETTSTVEGVATRVPGGPGTPEQVLALLPEHLRDARLALIDAPATRDFHTYGGNWVRDGNVNECTSGWSVTDGVDDGITTAGHCNGIDEIREPGNPDFPLTWQAQHTTTYGDVEWHTSTHFAPPQFYAASGDLRDVDSVEPRVSITVGEVVCGYGRASNLRVCDEVLLTSVTCGTSQRLVAMENQDVLTNGDSGGGWSFSTKAYGSVKGACIYSGAWRDVWSVADLYDEALGVTVITT